MSGGDRILVDGPIITSDGMRPTADALGVVDGRIAAVGDRDVVRSALGPRYELLDAGEGCVCAGFHDAHIHLLDGALFDLRCNLHDLSRDEYAASIRRAARGSNGEWVRGGGWNMAFFEGGNPTRQGLDVLVPDQPAYLTARDGHSAWVNTAGLALAGISAATPDPPGGRIEREADGRPAGTLHETAMRLVEDQLPETTDEEWRRALELGQRYMHSLGIVGWQEAKISPSMASAYLEAASDAQLHAWVALALHWRPEAGLDQLAAHEQLRETVNGPTLRADTVKVFVDGVLENRTAALHSPYVGVSPQTVGDPLFAPDELRDVVAACTDAGFQIHFHAIGDWATHHALNACANAIAVHGAHDLGHQISHLQLIAPDDVPRFAALNVIANVQAYWACLDEQMKELCLPLLGPERAAWQYPFRALLDSGATLAFGSDWRVSTPNPLSQMAVAVTRQPHGEPVEPPLNPGERIPLEAALAGFTLGSAYASRWDRYTGRLAEGLSADLVFLSADPRAIDVYDIAAVHVKRTVFRGRVIYEKGT